MFIICDDWGTVRVETDPYDRDTHYVPLYETLEVAQVAAELLNDEYVGYIPDKEGGLIRVRPYVVWKLERT